MNWDAIGAVGEIVGAVAVLVSLVFVGLQVRQSADQTRKSNVLARADMTERVMRTMGDTVSELARHTELASAFRKVMFESSELTPIEQTTVLTYLNVWLQRHRTAYLSVSDGLIDARVVTDFDNTTKWYLSAKVFADEWGHAQRNGLFTGEFADHVNRELLPDEAKRA
ncbi:MAG: hypothetical protein GKR90_22490 [Pseudomonadales bacterium]|nr:hypothetical protein [Pseudomonadales bacterium]